MDELAYAAGKDPYEFRLDMLEQPKPRCRQVLERTAKRAGWGKAPAGRFQGIALMEGYGTYLAQVIEISHRERQGAACTRSAVPWIAGKWSIRASSRRRSESGICSG